MSNNYDMAYFTREQSIVGKVDLMKPFTFDESQLGYRPRYPEEEEMRQRASAQGDAGERGAEPFDLVSAARRETGAERPVPTVPES